MAGNVTPHFYTPSDRSGYASAPAAARANLDAMARLLEAMRGAGGSRPMAVTSGYRSAAYNAAVGGSRTSQHLTGSAADFKVIGASSPAALQQWAEDVVSAIDPRSYGQLIFYPWSTGHVHASLPNRASGETGDVRIETGKRVYTPWRPGTPFPAWGAGGIVDRSDTEGAASVELLIWILIAVAIAAAL